MWPLSLHQTPSGSVMTKCSGGRTQLSRNLSQPPRHKSLPLPHPPFSVTTPRSEASLDTVLRVSSASVSNQSLAAGGELSTPHDTRSDYSHHRRYRRAPWLDALTRVGEVRLRCLIVLFLVLSVMSRTAMCNSNVTVFEDVGSITFRTRVCQKVTEEYLRDMLAQFERERANNRGGYQGDDPNAGADPGMYDELYDTYDEEDNDEDDDDDGGYPMGKEGARYREEFVGVGSFYDRDVQADFKFNVEVETDDEQEREGEENEEEREAVTHGWRRRLISRRKKTATEDGRRDVPEKDNGRDEGAYGSPTWSEWTDANDKLYSYSMRRRRRRRAADLSDGGTSLASGVRDSKKRYRKADSHESRRRKLRNGRTSSSKSSRKSDSLQIAALKLSKNRNNRRLKKKLRREFRQLVKKQKNKTPPWACTFERKTLIFESGIYPNSVSDGSCGNSKCFFNLYRCTPKKYTVYLLKRDPRQCNPLPVSDSQEVRYEERWLKTTKEVTAGCECSTLYRKT